MDTILNSGDILNSRYQILKQIGHGGLGRTYLAEDINRLNELCVLKEFAPQLQSSFALGKAQKLFEREAGILYRLEHSQLPRFRELFPYQHQGKGCLLLVQDYIEGQTYRALVNNRSQQGVKFSETEITQLLCQILPVLEYIHSMGVIHRDISPDNLILRSSDNQAVLIDFGSIKEVETKAKSQLIEDISLEEAIPLIGTILGKNGYAPPEQIERGIVRAHSDLYGLAATAVVLLTGKEPRQLILPYNYEWHWQEEINLSPRLEWVLTKMLAPYSGDRFSSATEVRQALEDTSTFTLKSQLVPKKLPTNKMANFSHLTSKISFFVTFIALLFMGNLWWFKQKAFEHILPTISHSQNSPEIESQLRERFSQGEKILISQTTSPEQELTAAAFAKGNYINSRSSLLKSFKTRPQDPEDLIYLNNAQIGREKAYTIAVSVSIGTNANASEEILRGIAQAQTLVNQRGGIEGIPLKVQIINDDNHPETGK